MAGIARYREDVKRGKARLAEIEKAPYPTAHTKRLAHAHIERSQALPTYRD